MKRNIPLVIALLMGVAAVALISAYLKKMKADVYSGMEMTRVLVAEVDIPKGTPLSESNLAGREYPEKYVSGRAVRPDQASTVIGARTKFNLEKGKPVLWSDLEDIEVAKAGLAGLLDKGTRAVTLAATELNSAAHMIRPDDRVDILFTFDLGLFEDGGEKDKGMIDLAPENTADLKRYLLQGMMQKNQGGSAVAVLLRNVLVLATGTSVSEGEVPDRPGGSGQGYSTLTLKVTEEEAVLLTWCVEQGKITFLPRNARYPDEKDKRRMVTAEDLLRHITGPAAEGSPAGIEVK